MSTLDTWKENNMPTPAGHDDKIHIFFDLDGVLADFELHLQQENKTTADGKPKWDALDYEWWSTMPACDGAREFYDAVKKLGIVKFLTGPSLDEECYSGKARWVPGMARCRFICS